MANVPKSSTYILQEGEKIIFLNLLEMWPQYVQGEMVIEIWLMYSIACNSRGLNI